jgi:hypothetical protein
MARTVRKGGNVAPSSDPYAGVGNQRPRPFAGFPPRVVPLNGIVRRAGAFITGRKLTAENVQNPFAGLPSGRRPPGI